MIEFIPWYEPNTQMVRCLECGALLSSGDTELHTKWHVGLAIALGARL